MAVTSAAGFPSPSPPLPFAPKAPIALAGGVAPPFGTIGAFGIRPSRLERGEARHSGPTGSSANRITLGLSGTNGLSSARDHAPRRAGGLGVPIRRRHRGRQRRLRREPVHPARSAGRGARPGPRRAGRGGDVLRDRPRRRALGRGAWRRRPADGRGAGLRRGARLPAAARQHGGRLHRPRVPVRRQADRPRRPGGPLLRQAARSADGLRRLLHQPRRPTATTWTG